MCLCFYHAKDLDGKSSAAIVKTVYPTCELIGIDYGDPFPFEKITPNTTVIMVDFSIENIKGIKQIHNIAKKFIWIDHHQTAINREKEYNTQSYKENMSFVPIDGIRSNNLAGCELCWKFFYPNKEIPNNIKLLGRYDVFDLGYHEDVLPYQYGMRYYDTNPESPIWNKYILNDNKDHYIKTIQNGHVIMKFQKEENKYIVNKYSYEMKFENLKFICMNHSLTGSQLFDSIWDPNKYDAMMVYHRTPRNTWQFHMYTLKNNVDLSPIATQYGGGGHHDACGFEINYVPFEH